MPSVQIDHCTSCRVATGGLVACWLSVPPAWVSFELESRGAQGDSVTLDYTKHSASEVVRPNPSMVKSTRLRVYESSPGVYRTFCGHCGTSLTYAMRGRDEEMDVVVGTLDRAALESQGFMADRHGHWGDGIRWIQELVTGGGDGGLVRQSQGLGSPLVT